MLLCGNSLCLALGCLWSLQQEQPKSVGCEYSAAHPLVRQHLQMRRKRNVSWQHSVQSLWWRVWQIHILLLLLLLRLLSAGPCTIWLLMHVLKLLQLELLLCSLLPGRVQHGSDSGNVRNCSAVQAIKVNDCPVLCCYLHDIDPACDHAGG